MERAWRWGLVGAAAALMAWRGPQYLTAPSFWAEDGVLFFATAWNRGPLAGLVQRPAGYFLLYTNVATTLAAWLAAARAISLAAAPRVLAVAGLLAQLLPIALLAFAAAPAWGGPLRRAAAVAVVLVGTRTGNIWLNTVDAQFHLGLAAVVVLLEPADRGAARRRLHAAVVALATLTGPVASLLLPLFLVKAWRTRARATVLVAAVACLGAAVQLVCLALAPAGSLSLRAQGTSLAVLAGVAATRTIVLPLAGTDGALRFGGHLFPLVVGAAGAWTARLAGAALVGLVALVPAALAFGVEDETGWWLAASYWVVATGSLAGAVGDIRSMVAGVEVGARYVFVPGVLVLWLLVLNVRPPASSRRLACGALLAWVLVAGAWSWRASLHWSPAWPAWAAEADAWERRPRRTPLRIWPRGWIMRLAPRRS